MCRQIIIHISICRERIAKNVYRITGVDPANTIVYNVDATKLDRWVCNAIRMVNVHANRASTVSSAIDASRDSMSLARMDASKLCDAWTSFVRFAETVNAQSRARSTINRNAVRRRATAHASWMSKVDNANDVSRAISIYPKIISSDVRRVSALVIRRYARRQPATMQWILQAILAWVSI